MSANPVSAAESTTRRPGVLTAAVGIVVLTAIAAVVNGIMIATGGSELIKDILVEGGLPDGISDADLESAALLAGYTSLDDLVSTFSTRGYLLGGAGIALLVLGGLMIKAAKWVRILVTVVAALAIAFAAIILADDTTTTMAALAMVAVLGSVLAIVFTWLPAIGRYAKASAAQGRA